MSFCETLTLPEHSRPLDVGRPVDTGRQFVNYLGGRSMSIQITHVRFESNQGKEHESISAYKWRDDSTGVVDWHFKSIVVTMVENGTVAHTGTPGNDYAQAYVRGTGAGKYLQTKADGVWSNNLVNLPTF
jgi:hypothetical protein